MNCFMTICNVHANYQLNCHVPLENIKKKG